MNPRNTALAALIAVLSALPAGELSGGEAFFEDFALDPDISDCEPVCWEPPPCCPSDVKAAPDGIDLRRAHPINGGWFFSTTVCSRDPGLVIRARVTLMGTPTRRGANLGFGDPFNGNVYIAQIRGDGMIRLRRHDDGPAVRNEERSLPPLDVDRPLEFELLVNPTALELRVWPTTEERPDFPQLAMRDTTHPQGSPAFGVWTEAVPCRFHSLSVWMRPTFRRADSNADGNVDVSDGVHILDWLFRGGEEPSCRDAADADDNGAIELTDAVRVFRYLFLDGEKPALPGPTDCGSDPTEEKEELGCAAYGHCP